MEKKWRKDSLLFIPIVLVVLFLSACGTGSTDKSATSLAPVKGNSQSQSSLTPLQVLQKSEQSMKGVKAYHLVLNITINTKSSGNTSTNSSGTFTAALGSTNIPTIPLGNLYTNSGPIGNLHIVTTGSGDVQSTGNEKLNLTTNSAGQSSNLSEFIVGDNVYVKNPTDQKWYYGNKNGIDTGMNNSGFTLDQNSLLVLLQDAKIADHGTQSLKMDKAFVI